MKMHFPSQSQLWHAQLMPKPINKPTVRIGWIMFYGAAQEP